MGKLAIFDGNRRLSRKRCEMADSHYGIIFNDLECDNSGFKVTVQVEYFKKRCVLGTKLLKNTNRKLHNLSIGTTFNDLE